jgi:hypothetical protein
MEPADPDSPEPWLPFVEMRPRHSRPAAGHA